MSFAQTELRKFTDAGQRIASAAGVGFKEWADDESALILKAWAGLIGAQTPEEAQLTARIRVLRGLGLTNGSSTINAGLKGKEGLVYVRTKTKYKTKGGKMARGYTLVGELGPNAGNFTGREGRRVGNDQWAMTQQAVQRYQGKKGVLDIAKRTVGLARQSIIQIADALGLSLDRANGPGLSGADVARARNAVASNGQTYQNGLGIRTQTADSFSIEMINRYPKLREAKLDTALAVAVGQRINQAARTLGPTVWQEVEKEAASIPYVTTR